MKVLQVNVDDMFGGGVYALVKSVVVANSDPDIKIDIAATEKFQSQENIDLLKGYGTDVYYVGAECNKIRKQFAVRKNLEKFLKTHHYDCVHIHCDVAYKLYFYGKAAKAAGVKNIFLHSHASGIDGKHRLLKRLIHFAYRRSLKRLKVNYIACSDMAASWMYPNVKPENVVMLNNGVDLKRFSFDGEVRELMRSRLGVGDKKLITNVGRFSYQKNHKFILKIAREIKRNGGNMLVLLVGQGPDERKIKALCHKKGLDNFIKFFGTSNEIAEIFCASDVFILPSVFEGLPIVGVEAQATGLPCIFSTNITRQAKLIDKVAYLKTGKRSAKKWYAKIEEFASLERKGAEVDLDGLDFSIDKTTQSLLRLYKSGKV